MEVGHVLVLPCPIFLPVITPLSLKWKVLFLLGFCLSFSYSIRDEWLSTFSPSLSIILSVLCVHEAKPTTTWLLSALTSHFPCSLLFLLVHLHAMKTPENCHHLEQLNLWNPMMKLTCLWVCWLHLLCHPSIISTTPTLLPHYNFQEADTCNLT